MGQVIDPNTLLIKTDQQPATVAFFNNLITNFCSAINGVGVRMDGYDAAEANLVNLGLANINSTLGPFLNTLQEAAQLGFLVAQADGPSLSLTLGQPFDMVLTSAGASMFTPTQWLMVMDVNDSTNWGVLQLVSWVQQDLNLSTTCIYASKTKTSFSWQVTCGSGVLNAMVNDLAAANTAASNAATSASQAASSASTLNTALTAIQAGPVVSVAGRSGVVSLAESDIAGLTADLAGRPTTAYVNNAVAGLQPHSANLDQLTSSALSAFGFALFTAANAAAALGTLGAAPLLSPAFTGGPTAPTPTAGDNSTRLATTAFLVSALASYATTASVATYAPLASPALTGTPTAPTAAPGTSSTQLATTAFVQAAAASLLELSNNYAGSRTITAADINHRVRFIGAATANASGPLAGYLTLTLPTTSAQIPVGSWFRWQNDSSYALTFTGAGLVFFFDHAIYNTTGTYGLGVPTQYAGATSYFSTMGRAVMTGNNEWTLLTEGSYT